MKSPVFLDVSLLASPEPFQRILEALAEVEKDQYLLVKHRKEPIPLYGVLREGSFVFLTHSLGESDYRVAIWHEGEPETEKAVLLKFKNEGWT